MVGRKLEVEPKKIKEVTSVNREDRNFKFTREMRGYKKQQVDEKTNELYAQIDSLTAQNRRLNDALGEINEKIHILTESANQLRKELVSCQR